MNIKFTRSVLHKGEHQEINSIADLPKGEALFFIVANDAVEVSDEEAAAFKKAAAAAAKTKE